MSNEYEEFMNSNKNEDSSSAEEIDEVEIDTIDVEVVGVSIPFIDIFVLVFKYVIAFFLVSVCIAIIGFFITALLGISALIPNNAVIKNPIIAIHTDTKKKAITYLKTNTKISINGIETPTTSTSIVSISTSSISSAEDESSFLLEFINSSYSLLIITS